MRPILAVSVDTLPTSCNLCPRNCGANRAEGQAGVCGADDTLRIARAALHLWEEPCISVGAGSGTVFFTGCPLRCVYCQNYDIAHGDHGTVISPRRLEDIYLELQDQGAANINLVTATQYVPQVVQTIRGARQRGLRLPVVFNTSGYETVQTIELLRGTVDVYLADFKYWKSDESDAAVRYSHAKDYFSVAVDALDAMVAQIGEMQVQGDVLTRGVVLRHLLLPGRLQDSMKLMAFLWDRYGDSVLYSVMNQYTPVRQVPGMPELDASPSEAEYEVLLDFLDDLGMDQYFWQEGGANKESFIPPFDNTGVYPERS